MDGEGAGGTHGVWMERGQVARTECGETEQVVHTECGWRGGRWHARSVDGEGAGGTHGVWMERGPVARTECGWRGGRWHARSLERGANANSKHWFTTSFLWREVPESDARSVELTLMATCWEEARMRGSGVRLWVGWIGGWVGGGGEILTEMRCHLYPCDLKRTARLCICCGATKLRPSSQPVLATPSSSLPSVSPPTPTPKKNTQKKHTHPPFFPNKNLRQTKLVNSARQTVIRLTRDITRETRIAYDNYHLVNRCEI